ncbi:MAG: hypothetical protein M0Z59_04940, partial [Nitrospiraceae bacterium]|nr:hypothetical protein [Nitrospiraceae bacterium]
TYKASKGTAKEGHFGITTAMTTTVTGSINGLCTPCHDPHGVSPSLGANQAYGVPLLKGTWLTSPYKEDAAPLATNLQVGGSPQGPSKWAGASTPGYHIDQNTFETLPATAPYTWNFASQKRITETPDQFAGLCLKCHPKSSLDPGTNSTWKGVDRIHNVVKGWGTFGANANNAVHSYVCSKCHAPHDSALPRLLVTNCLDSNHRGQKASGGTAGTRQMSGSNGRGNGRFPAGGGGYGQQPYFYPYNGGGSFFFGIPGSSQNSYPPYRVCHDNANTTGETWPAIEHWNSKTPW